MLLRVYIYFATLLVISFSAVVFVLPVTTYYFHRVSVIAVPINLIVEPFLGLWILPVGLISVLFLPVSYTLACLILKTGSWGLDIMMNIIRYWSEFSWSSFWSITPNWFEVGLCYGMIFFFVFALKSRSWAKKGLLVVLVIGVIDISYWIYETRLNSDLRVTFIDVGQGNAALVQLPGRERLLIDGGGFISGTFDTGRMVVAPFLLYSKIHHIDYIVLSHPHPDHLNGLNFIAEHFGPKEFWYNGQDVNTPEYVELLDTIKKDNVKIIGPDDLKEGRDIAGVRIELLHPMLKGASWAKGRSEEDSGSNNSSLVLKISYRGRSFLFPGDIEAQGEQAVVSNMGPGLKSDVILIPHHGSRTSSSESFLQMVKPEISVISCGKDNSFKFPSEQTLLRLKNIDSRIIRTDESGAVQVSVGRDGLRVKRFLEPD